MAALSRDGIFTRLKKLREELAQQGMDIIDLSVGTPDQPPDPRIVETMAEALQEPTAFHYAVGDLPELRQAAARWYRRRFGVTLDPGREILLLQGSQDGLGHIALSLVNPGETVLVHDPGYPIFHAGPQLAQAELYAMPQSADKGYLVDFSAIPSEVARSSRLMIVSYPNNPTAAMAPPSFYGDLVAFARDFDIMVVHDNAYCELVFDGRTAGSFLSVPGARDVGVEFNSLSKTYNFAGARVGFAMGNADMIAVLATLKSHLDYGIFLPVQKAAVALLDGPQDGIQGTVKTYERRRNRLCDGMTGAGWPMERSAATMFVWTAIPDGFSSSMDFALSLARRTGILVTPGSSFGPGGEGYVRLALVQSEDRIAEAVQRVRRMGVGP